MTSEVCDTDEDDSAEIEELLAELEEDGSTSRYDNPHSSSSSHAETHSDTSIMQEKRGSPLSISHGKVEESRKATYAQSVHAEKASDAHSAHLRATAHLQANPLNNPMDYTRPVSPPKPSHAERHAFAVERPPSPPPRPLCGCTCFLLPSHKRAKKQKKYSEAEEQRSSFRKARSQQAMVPDKDGSNDGPSTERKKSGPQDMDAGGLFDVKRTEKEFKRASKKEKQLTQEAQKFLKTVASI